MTKIYDCFTFYNELDLLEIRLQELYDKVDYFVIVESNQTFTNRPKAYLFEENQKRYSKYADKIRHIKHVSLSDTNPWVNETNQRNAIMEGVQDAEPNDVIIVSDADELPRREAIDVLRNNDVPVFGLRMPLFNFKFNYMRITPGEYDFWAMAARKSVMDQVTPDQLRAARFGAGFAEIPHAGWHFGYLGDKKHLQDKARSFSHQEVNRPEFLEHIDIEQSIAERKEWDRTQPNRYEVVRLDSYFPESLKNYPKFILDNPIATAYNLLPHYPYE
jgi:hypothetical protein